MPLQLKSVPSSRGPRWIGDAWGLFRRKPLAFTAMFCVFLFAAMVVSFVPWLGGMVQLMAVPLLTLGFMLASQATLLGDTPHPRHFIEPLRGDPVRRRALLILCASFGVLAVLILWLCNAVSGDALARMQVYMAEGDAGRPKLEALMQEPGVSNAVLLGLLLGTALSIPYWHAAALVHWGQQGWAQALFSSTLAIWRSKGAFAMFALAWITLTLGVSMIAGTVLAILGLAGVAGFVAMGMMLLFTTLFYVAQLFTFNDSFGGVIAGSEGLGELGDSSDLPTPPPGA
jgi:hypothetical protein